MYKAMDEQARKHGDYDINRLGLFIEMPYLSWGKAEGRPKKGKEKKNPPMLGSFPKSKCGNQDGYFDDEFRRIFAGEYKKKKTDTKKAKLKTPFIPTGPTKKHSTPNDYFGTFFEEAPERFSPLLKATEKKGKKKKGPTRSNPMTNPVKKGGPGFVDICINAYPEHVKDPYGPKPLKKGDVKKKYIPFYSGFAGSYFYENPYTDKDDDPPKKPTYINREKEPPKKGPMKAPFVPPGPPKLMGNNHDGCFENFPEHMKEPFMDPWKLIKFVKGEKKKPKPKKGIPFIPTFSQIKTMQTPSTLTAINFTMNSLNYKNYVPQYVKYL